MDLNTALSDMLSAIGAANDEILAVLQVEPLHWAIGFAEDLTIEVEAQEGNNRLTLFCGLGTPLRSKLDQIQSTILSYNLLWRETGGMRMGLSGPGDQVFLIGDVYLPDTSEASLDQALFNMAVLARIWGRFVTEGTMGEVSSDPGAFDTMIRV